MNRTYRFLAGEAVVRRIMMVVIVLTLPFCAESWGEATRESDGASLDTVFMTIDLTHISLAAGGKLGPNRSEAASSNFGIEPVPWIVWRNGIRDYRGWIFTLNGQTGAQMGDRLEVTLPSFEVPADGLWLQHFLSGFARGIQPSPFIVCRNYILRMYHITYGLNGTPVESSPPEEFNLPIDPQTYGNATCMAEIPGTDFSDGKGRLFIGSDRGYIAALVYTFANGIHVEGVFSVSTMAIADLEPIPQYGHIILGALINGIIQGIHYSPTGHSIAFSLEDPRPLKPLDFDVFGAQDVPLADPDGTVRLILANGSNELALATITASESGRRSLSLTLDQRNGSIAAVAPGSLLMLQADSAAVQYDPTYSSDSGSSMCDVNVTDTVSDVCGYFCGDANRDGGVNVGDAVYVINYIFKGGPAPAPVAAGDANCDGAVNVGDAVHVINYIFKSGPAPCCP